MKYAQGNHNNASVGMAQNGWFFTGTIHPAVSVVMKDCITPRKRRNAGTPKTVAHHKEGHFV